MCRAKGDGKSTESSRSFLGAYNQKRTSVITIMEPVCSKQVSKRLAGMQAFDRSGPGAKRYPDRFLRLCGPARPL